MLLNRNKDYLLQHIGGTNEFFRTTHVSGNSEIYVEIDIEAGEESAKTDALIDLNFYDFDENNLSVSGYGTEEIEVDVLLDSIDEEDGIDAFALTNAAQVSGGLVTIQFSAYVVYIMFVLKYL